MIVGHQSKGIKGVRKTRIEAADRESTALMEKGGQLGTGGRYEGWSLPPVYP